MAPPAEQMFSDLAPKQTFTANEARSEGRAPAQLVGVFDRIAHRWYNDAR
jgi:hypothetical protein